MLISPDWLRKKTATDVDENCEAVGVMSGFPSKLKRKLYLLTAAVFVLAGLGFFVMVKFGG